MDPFKSVNRTSERNLPVPDQLYEIRQEIKALKLVEKELVEVIKQAGTMMLGADYVAEVRRNEKKTLDTKALKDWYGEDEIQPFYKSSPYKAVTLKKITE